MSKSGFAGLIVAASLALALTSANSSDAKHQAAIRKSLLAGSGVPVPVRAILQRACQDCHSENTAWPWYANIPPISARIHRDAATGRAFMDLSKWNDYTEAERRGFRLAIGEAAESRIMPPPTYTFMHREARLSRSELEILKAWAGGVTQ
jgi:Haem-binding domain